MATEAAVSDSTEDVLNLQKETEQKQQILSESAEDIDATENVATTENVAVTEDVATTEVAVIELTGDFSYLRKEDERLEPILSLTTEEVAAWIKDLGFPFYQDCFKCNGINGRKLIICDASTLCKLGITDFKHIKFIAKEIRDLLKSGEPYWNVSMADIPRDIKDLYLEQKSRTGKRADSLILEEFYKTTKTGTIWQPPLSNLVQSITHNGPHDI